MVPGEAAKFDHSDRPRMTAELVFAKHINVDFIPRLKRWCRRRGRGQRSLLGLTDSAGTAARNQKGHSEQNATDQDPPQSLRFSSSFGSALIQRCTLSAPCPAAIKMGERNIMGKFTGSRGVPASSEPLAAIISCGCVNRERRGIAWKSRPSCGQYAALPLAKREGAWGITRVSTKCTELVGRMQVRECPPEQWAPRVDYRVPQPRTPRVP